MKKLFLSMLVSITCYAGAFASNGVKELNVDTKFICENGPINYTEPYDDCFYTVFWTDTAGVQHSRELYSAGSTGSYLNCVQKVNERLDVLRSWGYTIDKYSISYGEDAGWW